MLNDSEMPHNAGVGTFTRPSLFIIYFISRTSNIYHNTCRKALLILRQITKYIINAAEMSKQNVYIIYML